MGLCKKFHQFDSQKIIVVGKGCQGFPRVDGGAVEELSESQVIPVEVIHKL